MAGPRGDVNANVGININAGPVDQLIAGLDQKISKTLENISKIGNTAANASGKMSKAAQNNLDKLSGEIKSLQRAMQQVQTLANAQARPTRNNVNSIFGTTIDDQKIARSVKAVNDFRRSLEESSTPAEKLRARINEITAETAKLAREGKTQSDQRLRQQEQLNASLKQYETFSSRLNNLQSKAGFLNPNSQKQLEGMFLEAQKLQHVFSDLAGDRRRYNFNFLTEAQKTITVEIDKQIAALTRQEAAETRLLQTTRERARALLSTDSRTRQIDMERSSASMVSRLAPAQLAYGAAAGDEGLERRLARSVAAMTSARTQLERAVATDSNASEAQVAKLIRQYELFNQKIRETVALQARRVRDGEATTRAEDQAMRQRIADQQRLYDLNQRLSRNGILGPQVDQEARSLSAFQKALSGLLGDGGLGLLTRVGIYAAAAGAIYNLIGAVKDGIKFAIQFEDKLASLQAISGATSTQMQSLTGSILEVGKNSRFSILELTDATTQLAQAGFSVRDMATALQSVSDFAAASGTSMKEATDLTSAAVGSFQLQVSETARVMDIFTAALNESRLTSQQIALAIQYVGTTAYEQNVSLEQLVATIGSVAQAGVRAGSTLGTGFRQLLVDLANPTDKLKEQLDRLGLSVADVDVKTKGLNGVLKTLREAGFGAAQAYQGLEVRAAAFFLAASNNLEVSQRLQLAESERGVAARATAAAMDTLSAQTQRFYNILGKIASDVTPTEALKEMVRWAADLAERIGATSSEFEKLERVQADLSGSNGVVAQLQTQAELWFKQGQEIESVETKLYRLLTTGSIYKDTAETMAEANERLATETANASEESANQAGKVSEVATELQKLITQGGMLRNDSIQTSIVTNELTSRFEGLSSMLGTTANSYDNLVIAMKRYNAQQLQMLGNTSAQEAYKTRNEFSALTQRGNAQIGAIRNSAEFRQLSGSQQREFNRQLGDYTANRGSTAGLFDLAKEINKKFPALGKQIGDLASTLTNRNRTRASGQAALALSADANFQGTNSQYRRLSEGLIDVVGKVATSNARATQQTPAERAAEYKPIVAQLDKGIAELTRLAGSTRDPVAQRNFQRQLGEYQAQRTAALGMVKPSSKETKDAEREAAKAERERKRREREAQRAQDKFNRNELAVSQSQLRSADRQLQSVIGNAEIGIRLSEIPKMLEAGDKALSDWIDARNDVLQDSITKAGMTKEQIKELTDAANDEIEAKQRATFRAQMDNIDKAVTGFIERQTRSIERQYINQNLDTTNALARQNGIMAGLQNPLIGQNQPNYAQTLQQRRIDRVNLEGMMQQAGTRGADGTWSGGTNQTRIEEYQQTIYKLQEDIKKISDLQDALESGPQSEENTLKAAAYRLELQKLTDTMSGLQDKTIDLETANANLRAQFDANQASSRSLGGMFSDVAGAYLIRNNIGNDPLQNYLGTFKNIMSDSTDILSGGLGDALDAIVMKTKSVGEAFKDMGNAVRDAIVKMATQAIATQIFGLLLSFIPGAGATAQGTAGAALNGFQFTAPALGRWNGGPINGETPKRLIGGGKVSQGLPTRDSVLVHAAQGEFMMKRSSVESIGHDLLNDMNNRGAAALSKLNNGSLVMPTSNLNSSVYVMLPEEQPQLGENDVIAMVNRDMLRGGTTKQLIKQIQAGG